MTSNIAGIFYFSGDSGDGSDKGVSDDGDLQRRRKNKF